MILYVQVGLVCSIDIIGALGSTHSLVNKRVLSLLCIEHHVALKMEVLPFRVKGIVLEHKGLLMGPHNAFRVVHRVLMHRLLAYNFAVES
jgi:hypothetical protein